MSEGYFLRTWKCAFAIAVRCMVLVVKKSLEIHTHCLFLVSPQKPLKGHIQWWDKCSFFSRPENNYCYCLIGISKTRKATFGCEATENEQPAVVSVWRHRNSSWLLSTSDGIKKALCKIASATHQGVGADLTNIKPNELKRTQCPSGGGEERKKVFENNESFTSVAPMTWRSILLWNGTFLGAGVPKFPFGDE